MSYKNDLAKYPVGFGNSCAPVISRGACLTLTSLSYFPRCRYHFKAHLSLKADVKPYPTIIDFSVFYLNRV